jgi:hypothetical protein
MKTQYILTEDEYGEIVKTIKRIGNDLLLINEYINNTNHAENLIIDLNQLLNSLKNSLNM